MSLVTDVILKLPPCPDRTVEDRFLARVNTIFDDELEHFRTPEGEWYGGYKSLQSTLAFGAFNYLDLDRLKWHLGEIDWEGDADHVQLFYKPEGEDRFDVWCLADGLSDTYNLRQDEIREFREALLAAKDAMAKLELERERLEEEIRVLRETGGG